MVDSSKDNHRKMRVEESVIVPLAVYQKLVDRCARERLNVPIANGSAFHARILIAKLFEIANEEVQIVSGELTDANRKGVDVYGHEPVIDAAEKFLSNPGTVLSVMLQRGRVNRGEDNRFLKRIISSPSRNGTIQICIPNDSALDESWPHFMVSDKGPYRLETGKDANPDEEAIKAVANFGDKKTGTELAALFSDLQDFFDETGNCEMRLYEPGKSVSTPI